MFRTLPRTVRRELVNIDEGDGHLWAVSYADLLMVLLAFFVIFFSFDPKSESQTDGLRALAMGLKQLSGAERASESPAGASATPTEDFFAGATSQTGAGESPNAPVADIKKQLADVAVASVEFRGQDLFLLLPDDIFELGDYQLTPVIQEDLRRIADVLKDHKDNIRLVVMGHSDSVAFSRRRNEFLGDNFDLSSLRALRALQYLLTLGFRHESISAQGAADGMRSSRTLSIRIAWKEEPK